jgi:hypothetical protein
MLLSPHLQSTSVPLMPLLQDCAAQPTAKVLRHTICVKGYDDSMYCGLL